MTWISPKKRLPKDCTDCWVCDREKAVFRAFFKEKPEPSWSSCRLTDHSPEDILAWQPYFTPDPP